LFKKQLLSFFVLTIVFLNVSAQTEVPNLEFIENKGQWDSHALLKANIGNGSLYFHKRGITVVLHNNAEINKLVSAHAPFTRSDTASHPALQRIIKGRPAILHSHAYSVNFLNMNEASEIIPDKPLDTYNNYFI
jgi:hypothetical protein